MFVKEFKRKKSKGEGGALNPTNFGVYSEEIYKI
jgi:hypothetical protein